jgi:nitrous oxidase accessory protein NosD
VNLAQAQGLTVADTTVRNHSGLGLVAQGQGVGMAGTVIRGLTVERTGGLPAVETAGVVLIDATGMRLESSNFSGDTTGIFVFNDAAGLVIVDNVFTGRATGVGLFQAKNLVFGQLGRGNTVQNAPGAGIYTGGNLAGTALVGNTIAGNAVGIVLDNTTNLAIGGPTDSHGNAITGTGNSTGIWARLSCSGTSIKKTRFSAHAADASLASATGIDFQP